MKIKAVNPKQFMLVTVLMLIVTMSLVACGQKGPLYLPEPSAQQEKQYESQQEEQDKNKDKQGNEN